VCVCVCVCVCLGDDYLLTECALMFGFGLCAGWVGGRSYSWVCLRFKSQGMPSSSTPLPQSVGDIVQSVVPLCLETPAAPIALCKMEEFVQGSSRGKRISEFAERNLHVGSGRSFIGAVSYVPSMIDHPPPYPFFPPSPLWPTTTPSRLR
jgi:hypothetical protein